MKKVLFLGLLSLDLKGELENFSHLKIKYEGLSKKIVPFIVGRGKPFHTRAWNTELYLVPEGFFVWPAAFIVAFYLCLTKKIDVIVAQSPLVEGFVATILKKIFRKELIVEIHGDWIEGPFLSRKRKFESFQRKIVPILAKFSFRSADKVRVISSFLKNEAIKVSGPKPYFKFPTFTDIDSFLEEEDVAFGNFILFVGFLSPVKNTDILIDSFSQIKNDFPGFKLLIIGEGPEKKRLEFQTKSLKLEDKVEFKGRLSLRETRNIMKNCYCLVLPSLSEGLGRVLMEAMALGKPVIASNVGGIPDLVQDGKNGFLFKSGNSGQLAEKLKILLNDKNLAVKFGQEGRTFVQENFSNAKYIENYVALINTP